jgi:transcriptional regulator NrdR family protein
LNWITLGVCFLVALFGVAQLGFLIGYMALAKDLNLDKIGYIPLAAVFAGIAAVYLFIRTIKNVSSSTDAES